MNIIKKIRKENNLNQSEFAKIINVHQTAVSQWENGRTSPDKSTARIISQKFNVSLDALLGNEKATQTEQPLTSKQKEVLQLAKQLTDEDVRKLIDYAVLLKKADSQ